MRKRSNKYTKESICASIVVIIIATIASYLNINKTTDVTNVVNIANTTDTVSSESSGISFSLDDIPEYSNEPYVVINNNIPYFDQSNYTIEPFENYSDLDELGRCGGAFANICKELMPTEKRGEIGNVKPTGWHTVRYDDIIEGKYLYNRCHLIGYQLAGENANEKNLITGTRYLNVTGMLPFENQVDKYVEDTNNHVLYRVTPIFKENNLVASGVQIEAYSVEDERKRCMF